LFVRLKQCEVALKAGRLDEAFDLLRSPDLRSHRDGQSLVDRLSRALLDRGRAHLSGGQFEAAAQDCERASRLAGNLPDVVSLRAAISDAMAERRRAEQRRERLATAVRRHMDQGQLTIGQQLLAAAAPDDRLERIESELAARRATVQSIGDRIGAELKAGSWEAALDSLARLDRQVLRHPNVRDLCEKATALVVAEAGKWIESGRLHEAGELLRRHQQLPGRFIEAERLRDALRQCREAAASIERSDAAGAERLLSGLSGQWPNARWMSDALTHVRQLRSSMDAVLAGPLGAKRSPLPAEPLNVANGNGAEHPDQVNFVLHVDGAGSFRVIGVRSVTLGPASSSRAVDIAVAADASVPAVTIARSDEDYFVQSQQPVEVNDKPVTHALLANGDRIAVGPRCRLRFRRPNPASATAVLDVIAGRLARGDVRQIILFDREMILGPGPAAHVRVDSLTGPAVLQRGGDGIVCRAADPISIDGRPADGQTVIKPGIHVNIGPLGLVLVREGEVGP
jgi:tetratricopeptide (TPR) repeat protein